MRMETGDSSRSCEVKDILDEVRDCGAEFRQSIGKVTHLQASFTDFYLNKYLSMDRFAKRENGERNRAGHVLTSHLHPRVGEGSEGEGEGKGKSVTEELI